MADRDSEVPEATKQKMMAGNKFFFKRIEYVYEYALETWYKKLDKFTLKTEFVVLDNHEIQALHHACVDKISSYSASPPKCKVTDDDLTVLKKVPKSMTIAYAF